MAKRIKYGD